MNVKTRGEPRITVAYDGVEQGGESVGTFILEIIGIVLFFFLIGVWR